MLIQIALRNILKNRRRSIITIGSIICGFVALSLFEGYFTDVYTTLEDQSIIGERLGHLTIAKSGYFEKGSTNPEEYAFSEDQFNEIKKVLSKYSEIELISPRVNVNGLISNGASSTIFIGEGIISDDVKNLRGEKYKNLPGRLNNRSDGIVIGSQLGKNLRVDTGSTVVLMSSTIDGMVNAVDATVIEAANTGSMGTDDKAVLLPLELGRKLLAFQGATKIVVLLKTDVKIDDFKVELVRELEDKGFQIDVRSWRNLSLYYGQVKNMFDLMFLFISIVVLIIAMASVINTMSMAVIERTREIGTMMAIGMKRRNIVMLFLTEGVFLAFIGCVLGIVLSYGLGAIINSAGISYTPPDASGEVNLKVIILFKNLIGSTVVLTVMSMLSSFSPAMRAARYKIVDALGHV